jgi:hypothetical protein
LTALQCFGPLCTISGRHYVEYLFDVLQKIGDLNFLWIEAAGDLRAAKARIIELQELTLGEYVVFDQHTQRVVAEVTSRATSA